MRILMLHIQALKHVNLPSELSKYTHCMRDSKHITLTVVVYIEYRYTIAIMLLNWKQFVMQIAFRQIT